MVNRAVDLAGQPPIPGTVPPARLPADTAASPNKLPASAIGDANPASSTNKNRFFISASFLISARWDRTSEQVLHADRPQINVGIGVAAQSVAIPIAADADMRGEGVAEAKAITEIRPAVLLA